MGLKVRSVTSIAAKKIYFVNAKKDDKEKNKRHTPRCETFAAKEEMSILPRKRQ